jgi:hypothetical protein
MAILTLPEDFKEFLKLLDSKEVEYLLVGGYAVSIHGYVRATNDLDIWVKMSAENARGIESALREFGFAGSSLSPELFLAPNNVIRMGVPPMRLHLDARRIWPTWRICRNSFTASSENRRLRCHRRSPLLRA